MNEEVEPTGSLRQQLFAAQERLHDENQRRLASIEESVRQISVNTVDLPVLKIQVDGLVRRQDQTEEDVLALHDAHTRAKAVGGLITFLLTAWEALRWFFTKH